MTSGHDKRLGKLEANKLKRAGPTLHIGSDDDPDACLAAYRRAHRRDPVVVLWGGAIRDLPGMKGVCVHLPDNGR